MERPGPLLFGKYRLVERIAQSEIAQVFEAKSLGAEGFEKTLLVELIRPELARMPAFAVRFEEHAKRALSLSHANIVQLYDFGEIEGSLFMAVEQVCGSHLGELLTQAKRHGESISPSLAVHIVSEAARALDYAHRRRGPRQQLLGIVHGRVCPSSILLSLEGEVKLADFGLGRTLQELYGLGGSPSMGKPAYMSPEQAAAERIDGRSDVFSLGAVLYECLSGVPAFEGRDLADTLTRVRACRYVPLDRLSSKLPLRLCETVHKALQLRPEDRQDTAEQLCDELAESLLVDGPTHIGSRDVARCLAALGLSHRPNAPSECGEDSLRLPGALRHDCTVVVLGPFESMQAPTEIERALERYGGRPLPALSDDGWWPFVFGLDEPVQDAEAALRFVMALRRAWSRTDPALSSFRAGLHCGSVWVEPAQPQNLSGWQELLPSALATVQTAERGATWVSDELARQVGDSFVCRRAGSDPGHWAVIEERAAPGGPSRLVGREASLRQFGDLLARAWRSSPNRLVIQGELGVGKSRLLDEAISELRSAGHAITVRIARLGPGCRGQPFTALAEMMRSILSVEPLDSPTEVAAKARRFAELGLSTSEQHALQSVLQAAEQPSQEPTQQDRDALGVAAAKLFRALAADRLSLFVFEAAERADADSLALFERWVTRERAPNAVLLFQRTPGLPWASPAWPSCHLLELAPLAWNESRELLVAKLDQRGASEGALAPMLAKAAGNPLFIEQYARALRETGRAPSQVPRRVRGAVLQRINQLRSDALAVAQLAALLDAELEPALLAELLAWPIARCGGALAELADAGLLDPSGPERYKLASEILSEVVRLSLSPELRHDVHLAVARAMERRGDWPSAIAQLEQALDTWPRSSTKHSLQLELYHRLGRLCVHAGASERGAMRMVAAFDLADALGRDDMAARFCMLRSELLAQSGQLSESQEWRARAQAAGPGTLRTFSGPSEA